MFVVEGKISHIGISFGHDQKIEIFCIKIKLSSFFYVWEKYFSLLFLLIFSFLCTSRRAFFLWLQMKNLFLWKKNA